MIASKLILFFWFYLLLLDNSLGQIPLVKQGENKKTFKNAIDFGATYGGVLGILGSQWKQLLFQLVQANRKVGLGKYQLARFNDSATEEVDLDIRDSYADKVAELVAIRTQDIGTTQKYVDDLEILKNEIALTMIVKMEEIKEKFKTSNVRKKVKEAKENGITDTDIKVILFAAFFDSGGGLSLIGTRASAPDALLSSFLIGMEIILDRKYFDMLGILQYANGGSGSDDGYYENEADEPFDPYEIDGDNEGAGGGPAGGGAAGGGAAGGGAPGGGGGDDPRRPSSGLPGDVEDGDEDDDEEDVQNVDFFDEFRRGVEPTVEGFEMIFFRQTREEDDEETESHLRGPPEFSSVEQENRINQLVNQHTLTGRSLINYFSLEIERIQQEATNAYNRPSPDRSRAGMLHFYHDRAADFSSLWERARAIYDEYLNFRHEFMLDYDRTRQNFFYYGHRLSGNRTAIDPARLPNSRPDLLAEFSSNAEDNDTRYLISRTRLKVLIDFGSQLVQLYYGFRDQISSLKYTWKQDQRKIAIEEAIEPRQPRYED